MDPEKQGRIAIIIPTLQEESTIQICLQHLQDQPLPFEVFVADGGSTDRTLELPAELAAELSYALSWGRSPQQGRSAQMNWGARQTQAEILLFLHADSRLPPQGLDQIRQVLQDPQVVGGRFRVRLDSDRWPYPLISWGINTRSRITGYFTGDMGIFIRRSTFETLGGYPDQPLMEDLEIAGRMRSLGQVAFLRDPMITSSRRWQQGGPWRTVALMQILRASYRWGVKPEHLAQWYRMIR